MPATTPVYALPYPVPTDPADVPADVQALATAIETKIAPGTATGQIPVWDNTAKKWAPAAVPSREVSYTEKTTSVGVTAGTEAGSDLVISDSARVFDGSQVEIEFFAPSVNPAFTANALLTLGLFDGGTPLGIVGSWRNNNDPASGIQAPACVKKRFTPTAASHTYAIRAWVAGGGGTVTAGVGGAGAFVPMYLKIVKT